MMTVRKKLDKNDLENILSYSNIVISSTSMQHLVGRQETYSEHLSQIDAFDLGLTGPINVSLSTARDNTNDHE